MIDFVHTRILQSTGCITLDRPKALNALSLEMVRALTAILLEWRSDPAISAVFIEGSSERAFCAGGDIRFFHQTGSATPTGDSALLEDFFTEEYALNHLIHHYPKPYIAWMDGIIMGGGMGIAQSGPQSRLRIVTERTRMAMPEVNIGLFPDVGGSYFLTRAPHAIGIYLGLTGAVIGAADALYAGLADVFLPTSALAAVRERIGSCRGADLTQSLRELAASTSARCDPASSTLALQQARIEQHFSLPSVVQITASLAQDSDPFAQSAHALMLQRSPLMMCVTLEQLRRGASMAVADCLRMERTMVRRCFEHGEVLEGVRAVVIDKDNRPAWRPSTLAQVTPDMVERFFTPAWPQHAHPLRTLE